MPRIAVKFDHTNVLRRKSRKTPVNAAKATAYAKLWRQRNPVMQLLNTARARSKRDSLPFDLNKDDLVVPASCPVLGIPLIYGGSKAERGSASLDKIVPELGYVKSNVQIISHKANTMKNDATLQELVLMGEWAKQLMKEKQYAQ